MDWTVKELLERYRSEYSPTKALGSQIRDRSLTSHLSQHLGSIRLGDVRPSTVSDYKATRRNEHASPATINLELALLRHAFNKAVREWEWCEANPVSQVSRERVDNGRERWLTKGEEKTLLNASPKWLQDPILFSLNTGLRQSEALNLQWPQVDLSRKAFVLLEQKNGKTNASTLPLNKKALRVLKMRSKNGKVGFVFGNQNGGRMDSRNLLRAFFKARDKAGLKDLRWHDLRHTWASRLVQNGCDLYALQRLGRWKSLSMVQRYGHHSIDSLRKSIELIK